MQLGSSKISCFSSSLYLLNLKIECHSFIYSVFCTFYCHPGAINCQLYSFNGKGKLHQNRNGMINLPRELHNLDFCQQKLTQREGKQWDSCYSKIKTFHGFFLFQNNVIMLAQCFNVKPSRSVVALVHFAKHQQSCGQTDKRQTEMGFSDKDQSIWRHL